MRELARGLDTHGAWVTEYLARERRLRAIAFWLGEEWVPHYEYDIAGTPCEPVVANLDLVHVPDRIIELYPRDPDLVRLEAVSYLGVPLLGLDGSVLGHLAVLDTKPMPKSARCMAMFQIFAARAAAELNRLRAESAVRDRDRTILALADEGAFLRAELRTPEDAGGIVVTSTGEKSRMGSAPALSPRFW